MDLDPKGRHNRIERYTASATTERCRVRKCHIGTKCPHMVESEHFGILMEVMALVEHSYHSLLYTDGVELIPRVIPIPPPDY